MTNSSSRFLALDVFRGMTVCFMIIVNTPGIGADAFAPLQHAKWHGFTPTDLVFPSFLFAVGNAMSFGFSKSKLIGDGAYMSRVIKRTLLIFLLGYLLYWFPFFTSNNGHFGLSPIAETRIFGVLQRIALCYFFAAVMIRFLSRNAIVAISVLLLLGYWILLLLFGDATEPYGMLTNAGTYIDKYLLGDSHLYHGEGVAFDPEGILSTLPAIVNVIIGFYAGKFIQEKGKNYETISKLCLTGAVLIVAALFWNMVFPINKKLWSSPFVLLTTGIDLIFISALIYTVEIRVWNKWNWTRFFTIFGKNPLFIYLLSELLITVISMIHVGSGQSIYEWVNNVFFQVIAPGAIGSFLFAIAYMLVCWLVGLFLEKKQIYIRV
jgi:predicted acyltransferase